MKAKTVRLLAGGLAAVTLMSNMAVMPVFADEEHITSDIQTTAMAEDAHEADDLQSVVDSINDEYNASNEGEADSQDQDTEQAAHETEAESQDEGTEQAAEEAPASAESDEKTEAESAKDETKEQTEEAQASEDTAEKADDVTADAEESEKDQAETVQEEDADSSQDQAEAQTPGEDAVNTADDKADATEAGLKATDGKEKAGTDLFSAQNPDLLSADEEDEPMLGSAPTEESPEVKKAKEESVQREKQAREIASKITSGVKSPEDILKILDSLDTIKRFSAENHEAAANETNKAVAEEKSSLEKTCEGIFKEAIGAGVKAACDYVPGASILESTLKGLVFDLLGLNEDKQEEDTNKKIDQLGGEILRGVENIGSIGIYGTRLDSFTTGASTLSRKIASIKSDKNMSENEKAIRIADAIGGSDKWHAGEDNIFSRMDAAAQTMRTPSHKGPQADVNERNLFDVFYDYFKDKSLFTGEAIARANDPIQSRTRQYIENCKVLTEALKAHERVAELSEKEVAALSPEVKNLYNRTKTDKTSIRLEMKGILRNFTGNKEASDKKEQFGIFDALKEFNQKDRLSYIEKDGANVKETKFYKKLYTQKSEDFNKETLKSKSALNTDQIRKLQEHVNGLKANVSMKEYLRIVGFNMDEIQKEQGNRKVYLSTLESRETDPYHIRIGGGVRRPTVTHTRYDSESYKGFDIDTKGSQESTTKFVTNKRYVRNGQKISDGLNIVLRTQKAVEKDEEAEMNAWFDKQMEEGRRMRIHPPTNPREPSLVEKIGNWFKNLF